MFKKHTGRKAGAMATSCSSTNQITTVKKFGTIEIASHIFQTFQQNRHSPLLTNTITPAKHSAVDL